MTLTTLLLSCQFLFACIWWSSMTLLSNIKLLNLLQIQRLVWVNFSFLFCNLVSVSCILTIGINWEYGTNLKDKVEDKAVLLQKKNKQQKRLNLDCMIKSKPKFQDSLESCSHQLKLLWWKFLKDSTLIWNSTLKMILNRNFTKQVNFIESQSLSYVHLSAHSSTQSHSSFIWLTFSVKFKSFPTSLKLLLSISRVYCMSASWESSSFLFSVLLLSATTWRMSMQKVKVLMKCVMMF